MTAHKKNSKRLTARGQAGASKPGRRANSKATSRKPRLVIGIGASAGGLEAFRAFFDRMPADSGMAFVLVQHLDPHHKSMLVDLLGSHTKMKVTEAVDGMRVAANCIYIIPPNATLTLREATLQVSKPAPPREHRRPIDTFFASLAEDQGERAVCVVLSGTGSDGTLGLRGIKEQGGLSLAQADFDATAMSGMPQSAAATGLVDHIIPVSDMPALLMDYQQHLANVAPQKDGDGNRRDMGAHLSTICALLRSRTGHDFSRYKQNTLQRRIQRRMQVLRIDTASAFIERLKKEQQQIDLLFREFLIGVTQFFRDPQAFEALEKSVIPKILEHKSAEDQIRIWVPACATGEEVYSIAILVREALERQGSTGLRVQIFGTDIDDAAVAIARAARYARKMEGVSPERLERWFAEDGAEFCPMREIREMCIFSTHSAVKDPPFSKLDLISCRNLLIYLQPDLQDRLMQTFHYALRPGGYLCLGQSESTARKTKLFETVDKKHRIFQRRESAGAAPQFLLSAPPVAKTEPAAQRSGGRSTDALDIEVRRVMERHSPAYVVIDRHCDILRFSGGEVGRYLEPSPGVATLNLFSIVRKALRPAVRAAVQQAVKAAHSVTTEQALFKVEGKLRSLRLIVEPIADERGGAGSRWVVAFQESPVPTARKGKGSRAMAGAPHPDVQALEQELQTTKTQLRATIDELETSSEEMKSANEEYQSVNEELQSSNEELETAKEEMQSVNEELQTINAEMIGKNEMLTRLNSDLKNLLDSTQIATLFLDDQLHIKNFTPAMTDLFHLRDSDRGRPITEIVARMHYADLERDVVRVLRTLSVIEHEVQLAQDDTVFLMRIRPYRTVDNVIDGVVITFFDISDRKRHEQARTRLAAIVEYSQDAIVGKNLKGIITSWNAGAQRIFGYSAAEIVGKAAEVLYPPQRSDEELAILERARQGEPIEHFEIEQLRKDGQKINVSLSISPVRNDAGEITAISMIARDVTERRQVENHRNLLLSELDHRVKNTLMIISSLVAQTVKNTQSPQEFAEVIEGRIQALSRVHSLLNLHQQNHAELREIVVGELAAWSGNGAKDRITILGTDRVWLTAKATQTLAMAFHELCTNAAKYGALSTPEGRIEVRWSIVNTRQEPRLSLSWVETGGPPVRQPVRQGFGSQLIGRIVNYELEADVERKFEAEGVRCTIEFPLTDKTGYVARAAGVGGDSVRGNS